MIQVLWVVSPLACLLNLCNTTSPCVDVHLLGLIVSSCFSKRELGMLHFKKNFQIVGPQFICVCHGLIVKIAFPGCLFCSREAFKC